MHWTLCIPWRYTIEEKVEIAKRHLLPKQLKEHGLAAKDLKIGKRQLEKIVEGYTRESGVFLWKEWIR